MWTVVQCAGVWDVATQAPRRAKPGYWWTWLHCDGDPAWREFRSHLASYRQRGFPPNISLAEEALALIEKSRGTMRTELWVGGMHHSAWSEKRTEECYYGYATALFVYGVSLFALGKRQQAQEVWTKAVDYVLGNFLSLDFMESTDWGIRSADILLALSYAEKQGVVRPAEEVPLPPPKVPSLRDWYPKRPIRVIDAACVLWSCDQALPDWSKSAELCRGQRLKLLLVGDHPALVEALSALKLSRSDGEPWLQLEYRWFDVRAEACALIAPFCSQAFVRRIQGCDQTERFREIFDEAGLDEVRALYKHFTSEMLKEYDPDVMLCLLFRDAYFVWQESQRPTILYFSVHYLYNDGTTEFSFELYVRWFQHFLSQDMVLPTDSERQGAPTATVAISALCGELQYDDLGSRVPSVRPLGLHVQMRYQPNSSAAGHLRVAALCTRPNVMSHSGCRSFFQESRRLLPLSSRLQIWLPPSEAPSWTSMGGMSWDEVSRFDAFIFIPWAWGTMTFRELYGMNLPLFVHY